MPTLERSEPKALSNDRVRRLAEAATESVAQADRDNTRRAYASDLADAERFFDAPEIKITVGRAWQRSTGEAMATAELALYVAHLDTERRCAVATIRRRIAAISRWHRDAGLPSPTDEAVIRRQIRGIVHCHAGKRTVKRKRPYTAAHFLGAIATNSFSLMHRALLVVGLVSGCRRSELVALRWTDLQRHEEGYVLKIFGSKTDAGLEGQVVALPRGRLPDRCPCSLLDEWQKASDPTETRIFPVSAQTVRLVVLRAVRALGLDSKNFGAHSLRAGFMTMASKGGVPLAEAMKGSRHKSVDVAASYIRDADALENLAHQAVVQMLDTL